MDSLFTRIEIVPIRPHNGLLGYASVIYRDEMYLGNIAVIRRKDGSIKVGYPSKKVQNSFLEIFKPLERNIQTQLVEAISKKIEDLGL